MFCLSYCAFFPTGNIGVTIDLARWLFAFNLGRLNEQSGHRQILLGELHVEKFALQNQISELSTTIARLMALENEETAALAMVGDICRREVGAMTECSRRRA